MANKQQIINASEIGTYTFCPRAWALEKRGYRSSNHAAMTEGTKFHQKIGKREQLIHDLKVLNVFVMLILLALILRYFVK